MRGTLQVFDSSSKTFGYTCVLQVRILPILECDACISFYVPPLLESGASYKHIISTVKHWTAHSELDLKKKKKRRTTSFGSGSRFTSKWVQIKSCLPSTEFRQSFQLGDFGIADLYYYVHFTDELTEAQRGLGTLHQATLIYFLHGL